MKNKAIEKAGQINAALQAGIKNSVNRLRTSGTAAYAFSRAAAKKARHISVSAMRMTGRIGLTGAFMAAAAFCTVTTLGNGAAVLDYMQSDTNPALIRECNEADRLGTTCSPAAQAERQRARETLGHVSIASVGLMGALGFGLMGFDRAVPARRRQAKPA